MLIAEATAKFEEDYKELVEEWKQKSIEVLEDLQTEINTQIESAKAKIAEYRETLKA